MSASPTATRERRPGRRGFTLIELLVVILIILLVSALALPTVLPAINHRQVSEAARILQGALAGARDKAIHDGQPCGIRLLPDPTFPITYLTANQINPYTILAYNRVVPIDSAPEYSEGAVSVYPTKNYSNITGVPCLVLEQAVLNQQGFPNSPTSWAWNVRIGDQVQINNAGPWYTIIGPLGIKASAGNTELFVNYGIPPTYPVTTGNTNPEYLLLTNGRDDNGNGWVDEGFDGVDNDGDGQVDEIVCQLYTLGEWVETEAWDGLAASGPTSVPYTIRRRPAPSQNAREIALPTSMVIDATGMLIPSDRERSRLPITNPLTQFTGAVDIVVNPDGTVLPTMTYGAPSSVGIDQAFYHFWLAERQDLVDIQYNSSGAIPINGTAPYYLPIARPGSPNTASLYPGPYLKGEYTVVTLFARTGQVVANSNPPFLYDSSIGYNNQGGSYHPYNPFIPAEQGISGGP